MGNGKEDKFSAFSEDVATADRKPGSSDPELNPDGSVRDTGTPVIEPSQQPAPTEGDDFNFGKAGPEPPKLDADGKPIIPVELPKLDADGKPIVQVEPPKLDTDGKPITLAEPPKLDADGKPITPAAVEPPKLDAEGKPIIAEPPPPVVVPGIEIKSGEEGVKAGDEVLKDGEPMADGKGTLTDGRNVVVKDGKVLEISQLPVMVAPETSVISLDPGTGVVIDKDGQVNWQDFGKTFELDLADNKLETFQAGINGKIDAAKKETDLSDFTPEAQSLIKHLQDNNGDMLTFLENPALREMNNFLEMSDVEKYTSVEEEKMRAQGKDNEEIQEQIETDLKGLNTMDLKKIIEKYDTEVLNRKQELVAGIVKKREDYIAEQTTAEKTQSTEEKTGLKKLIDETASFRGYPISQEVRTQMKSMVDSEDFLKVLDKDVAKAQLYAFLDIQFGGRIQEHIDTKLTSASRDGYNTGVLKKTGDLHNIPPVTSAAGGQGLPGKKAPETRFSSWTKEVIEGEEGDSV